MQYFVAKFGVDPSYCVQLVKHVKLGCPNLIFSGLMTIGMLDYSSTPENFKVMFFQATILLQLLSTFLLTVIFVREQTLSNCRTEVCKELGIPEVQCELSIGMSADFEQAVSKSSSMTVCVSLQIEMGSTNVRIGSTIFGAREYLKKDKRQ
ncbi:hypothetical protein BHE74_00050219 [Ensete ventricosum]|nr:hypothetical protein GW17_00047598 [Ensete ventricosum]RWW44064.1 hypothetical protein BHE74_00050219 [Ensete ventricosum]